MHWLPKILTLYNNSPHIHISEVEQPAFGRTLFCWASGAFESIVWLHDPGHAITTNNMTTLEKHWRVLIGGLLPVAGE